MKRFGRGLVMILLFLLTIPVLGQGFAPKVDYPTGAAPRSAFASDLDGDGDNDLAVVNYWGDCVSILKNNGDGTFTANIDYATGADPLSVFASDLDGDGDNDLAIGNMGAQTVSVLKNNGDGTFAPKIDYGAVTPRSVIAADLDGDTDNDLAVANEWGNAVSVFRNNGDATFAAQIDYPTGEHPYSVIAADLDGDTDNDLAVANFNIGTVSVLMNNGNGTFAGKVDYPTDPAPASIFASDLDGDSDRDLAVSTRSYSVSVLKNNGDGTFTAKVDYPTGVDPWSLFAANLDNDTDIDLAVANGGSDNISVLKNNGDGTFAAKVDYATGGGPFSVFAADLDGDTDNELIAANFYSHTVSVLINWAPTPVIISIDDVGNDQGKEVRIKWKNAAPGDTSVKQYEIFRRIDDFAASAASLLLPGWEQVATFSAHGETLYNGIVSTLADSTVSGGLKWSVFFVRAATNNPVVFFDSPLDSGYSVDNLVPSPPANLQATGTATIASLHWSPVSDGDFDFYYVYRDTLSGFSLSPAKRVKATSDTLTTDSLSNPNKAYYYLVTAVDFSGNEGPASNQAQLCTGKAGDANASGTYTLSDVIAIVNYIFNKPGCAPQPQCWLSSLLCRGDWNGSGTVSLSDVIAVVNYIFNKPGGPWNALPVGVCCLP